MVYNSIRKEKEEIMPYKNGKKMPYGKGAVKKKPPMAKKPIKPLLKKKKK